MARAKIIVPPRRLQLTLTLHEASALHALLTSIPEPSAPDDDEALGIVAQDLHGVWDALGDHAEAFEDFATPAHMMVLEGEFLIQPKGAPDGVASEES